MTKAQVLQVLTEVNDAPDVYTALTDVNYIAVTQTSNLLFCRQKDIRFRFDTTNEIMEVIKCRAYSQGDSLQYPGHSHYDEMDNNGVPTVYEYLVDINNDIVLDYYSFDAITLFAI